MPSRAVVTPSVAPASTDRPAADPPAWRLSGATMARFEIDGRSFDVPLRFEVLGADGGAVVAYESDNGAVTRFSLPDAAPAFRRALLRLLTG